jgi:2-keto-3-deoxy-L-rhamnonate aldolase RhmA
MPSFTSVTSRETPCIGLFISIFSDLVAGLIGSAGYDCVIIDTEHTPMSAREATHVVHAVAAASNGTCSTLVRIPSHGVEWVKWALDSGADGIVVPMVNSEAEARQIVQKARYPPLGQRSYGPIYAPYAAHDAGKTQKHYVASKVPDLAVLVMLESAEGVQNAKAILASEGVSGAFVGPFDLRLSLGLSGGDGDEPLFLESLCKIVEAGKAAQKPVGIFATTTASLQQRLSLGFDYIINGTDSGLLAQAAETALKEARAAPKVKQATNSSVASTTVAGRDTY